tara:strand:+ start:139 stop:393 length:255 start_codon:yes stop_codon:yes gene_type:complete
MKRLSLILFFLTLCLTIFTKILVSDQENQIKKLESKMLKIDDRINKLKVDLSYVTRPKKLQEINSKEFNLLPIYQEDIIEYKND